MVSDLYQVSGMLRSENMQHLLDRCMEEKEELPALTWPGMYPLIYLTGDGGILCPKCVRDNMDLINDPDDPQWYLVAYDIYEEGPVMYCENCNDEIESAYGDPESEEE